jgi:hypothetical protein
VTTLALHFLCIWSRCGSQGAAGHAAWRRGSRWHMTCGHRLTSSFRVIAHKEGSWVGWFLVDPGHHGCTYARAMHHPMTHTIRLSGLRLHLTSLMSMNLMIERADMPCIVACMFQSLVLGWNSGNLHKKPNPSNPASYSNKKTTATSLWVLCLHRNVAQPLNSVICGLVISKKNGIW